MGANALVVLHKSVKFPPGLSRRDHNWLATKASKISRSPSGLSQWYQLFFRDFVVVRFFVFGFADERFAVLRLVVLRFVLLVFLGCFDFRLWFVDCFLRG